MHQSGYCVVVDVVVAFRVELATEDGATKLGGLYSVSHETSGDRETQQHTHSALTILLSILTCFALASLVSTLTSWTCFALTSLLSTITSRRVKSFTSLGFL